MYCISATKPFSTETEYMPFRECENIKGTVENAGSRCACPSADYSNAALCNVDRLCRQGPDTSPSTAGACTVSDIKKTFTDGQVEIEFTASGDVSDFDQAWIDALRDEIAQDTGVNWENILITVTGGSVNVFVLIYPSTEVSVDEIADGLADAGVDGTPSSIEAYVFVATGTTVVVAAGSPSLQVIKPEAEDDDSSGLSVGAIAGIAVGCFFGLLLCVVGIYFVTKGGKKGQVNPDY
jgi:hypothetical protein